MSRPDDERVLPEQTGDDTDLGWGDERDADDTDRLTADRPPHYDRDRDDRD